MALDRPTQSPTRQNLTRPLAALGLLLVAAVAFASPAAAPWVAIGLLLLAGPAMAALRWRKKSLGLREETDALKAELQLTRQALELSHRRHRLLLDHAGDAIFLIDPKDGAMLEINRGAEELLGYSAREIGALSLGALFPGHNRRRYLRLVRKVLREGYGEEGSLIFRRRSGAQFIGAVHARLGRLGSEQIVHGVVRDVSSIKQTEQELRRKNRDLLLINRIVHRAGESRDLQEMLGGVLAELTENFEADGGGVYLLRHGGTILDLVVHRGVEEPVLEELRRLTPGQGLAGRVAASGQPRSAADLQIDRRLQSPAVRTAGWRGFQAVPLSTGERTVGVLFIFSRRIRLFTREELKLLLAIGKQVGTAVAEAELFDALQWQVRLTRASNRELENSRRELKSHLGRLEEVNRSLERLDRMKSRFLGLASHELRTPLTYVLSGAEYLLGTLGGHLPPEGRQVLEAIHVGGKRLNEIVDDLLEMARLESQSLYLAREKVDLAALIGEVGSHFQPILQERGLALSLGGMPTAEELLGDYHHLRRTFHRLLENAVKFTPQGGGIEIAGARRSPSEVASMQPALSPFAPAFFASPPRVPFLQVTVRDTGIGIEPEEQVRIFDKFYEVGDIASHFTSQTRFGGKGVGLGLTLVKGVVEAHGGLVWVESPGTPGGGGGSAFHVLLPLCSAEREPSHGRD